MLLQAHGLEDGEWQYNGGVLKKVQAQTQRPQLEEMRQAGEYDVPPTPISAPAPIPALEIARAPVQQASRLVLDALAARESNDAEKAVELAGKAIAAGEHTSDAYVIKASCLGDLRRYEEAMDTLTDGMLDCHPDTDRSPMINERAFQRLMSGLPEWWKDGWKDWDARPQRRDIGNNLAAVWPAIREWGGQPDATVLVLGDKGLGDTILFARYLSVLKDCGCRIQFSCSKASSPFANVLAGRLGGMAVYRESDEIPKLAEYWIALESLVQYTEPRMPDWPPFDFHVRWDPPFGLGKKELTVGLCWHGAVGYAAAKHRRPEDVSLWEGMVARTKCVRFVSLQLGEQGPCSTLLPAAGSVLDTVKAASKCDVVVAIDTSVAHMAASIGVPTWVPIHRLNYWPWILTEPTNLECGQTIWYPSMRLIRQPKKDDWGSVFDWIAKDLNARVTSPKSKPARKK